MMNGDQYRELVTNLFGEGSEQANALGTANTDWQDLIYREAWSHDHNVTVSGSVKDVLPYRVSLGYTSQDGILKTSNYNRYTASVNLNPSFFQDHLTLNLNAKGMYSKARKANNAAIGAAVGIIRHKTHTISHQNETLKCWGQTKTKLLRILVVILSG